MKKLMAFASTATLGLTLAACGDGRDATLQDDPMMTEPGMAGAQAPSANAMAFPRDALNWYFAGDAEQVWNHSGQMLRELAESPEGLRGSMTEVSTGFGPETEVLSEQLLEHPEGGGMLVYVRAVRHSQIPEMFWIVIFSPSERKIQMIMPQPRQTIGTLFPEVVLP